MTHLAALIWARVCLALFITSAALNARDRGHGFSAGILTMLALMETVFLAGNLAEYFQ